MVRATCSCFAEAWQRALRWRVFRPMCYRSPLECVPTGAVFLSGHLEVACYEAIPRTVPSVRPWVRLCRGVQTPRLLKFEGCQKQPWDLIQTQIHARDMHMCMYIFIYVFFVCVFAYACMFAFIAVLVFRVVLMYVFGLSLYSHSYSDLW